MPTPSFRRLSCYVLALLFAGAGLAHFIVPAGFVRIVPPYLPTPLLLVYLSGVAEVAGGLGLLWPTTRRLAGSGLMLLLIAVFPANIYMLQAHGAGLLVPDWALWLRLPLQAVLLAWVWWSVSKPKRVTPSEYRGRGVAKFSPPGTR